MYYGCTYLNYIDLFIHYPILVLPRVISTNTSAHFFFIKSDIESMCICTRFCNTSIYYKVTIYFGVFLLFANVASVAIPHWFFLLRDIKM